MKINMEFRIKYIKYSIWVSFIILMLVALNITSTENIGDLYIDHIFVKIFSNIDEIEIKNIGAIILYSFNFIILCFIFGDYVSKFLRDIGPYILIRTIQRRSWYISRALELLIYIAIYYLIQGAVIFSVCFVFNVNNINNIYTLIYILFNNVIFAYMLVLLVNMLSLKINYNFSYFMVLLTLYASIFFSQFICLFNKNNFMFMRFLPTSLNIISFHNSLFKVNVFLLNSFRSVIFALPNLLIILIILIVIIVTNNILKNIDIL